MNYSPPKPEVILTNFFAEPTVLLVPITSRALGVEQNLSAQKSNFNTVGFILDIYTGLTLEGDLGEEDTLWRLISLSRWSKAKFNSYRERVNCSSLC